MDTAGVIRRVQRTFGDSEEVQIFVSDICDWITDGQLEIVRQTQCLTGVVNFSPTSPTQAGPYTLPTDFLYEARVTWKNYPLVKTTLADLDDLGYNPAGGTVNGVPEYFYFRGGSGPQPDLWLWPPISDVGTNLLSVDYIKNPAAVTTSTTPLSLPVGMHESLVAYCLQRARELNEDYQGSSLAESKFDKTMAWARDMANNPHDSYPVVRDYEGDRW